MTVAFPSAYPASRKEIAELSKIFDQMFASTEGPEGSHARIFDAASSGNTDGILALFLPQSKALDAVLHEARLARELHRVKRHHADDEHLAVELRQHRDGPLLRVQRADEPAHEYGDDLGADELDGAFGER